MSSSLTEILTHNFPSIPIFFEGNEIFITGGTGFMGKALVEKLLRSCPKIKTIYLLMRPKKNKSVSERLDMYKEESIFYRLNNDNPAMLNKLVVIEGDVSLLKLGMSQEDFRRMENVSIIFHVAASVRFDDDLKYAVIMNTRGTREVMKFAETLKNLIICVHVSTTYCNPKHDITIEEIVYPPPADWMNTIKAAENTDEEMLKVLTIK